VAAPYQRVILHSDLNSFYASVECMLDPSLKGKAVAVCGNTDDRHGIVLAKSELAKRAGVKTAQVVWQAKRLCPELIMVPPRFDQYLKYSRLTRAIYCRYTDQVEPYGMDECWLDLTGCHLSGGGEELAHRIRNEIKEELGLTVSIGVSFNKIFAKLGSDMKKPDAVTVVDPENFKEMVWKLPATDLLYVGRATGKKLYDQGIYTIGDIAQSESALLQRILGKNGLILWMYANGLDESRVIPSDHYVPAKSVGHGITCSQDLHDYEEVWPVFLDLTQDIGHKLRIYELSAQGIQIAVKDNTLSTRQYQAQLDWPTQSPMEMAEKAGSLFTRNYLWDYPVRALTVRAINLIGKSRERQLTLFDDSDGRAKVAQLDDAVDMIRSRFGKRAIQNASLLGDLKIIGHDMSQVILPGRMQE